MDSTKALVRRSTDPGWAAAALGEDLAALRSTALSGLEPVPGEGILAGPSHVTRWKHLAANGAVPLPFEKTHFAGGAGLPAWNRSLFEQVANCYRPGMPVVLILPDPRWGNSVLAQPEGGGDGFADGHTHVSRELISPEGDALMIRRHAAALGYWWAAFGEDLRLLPWTGLLTAHVHLERGDYWSGGRYSYPAMESWLGGDAARVGAEDLSALLTQEAVSGYGGLYCDRSLHPSLAGYVLLMHAAAGAPFAAAMAAGQAARDRWVWRLRRRAETLLASSGPVRISGGPAWQKAARLSLGAAALEVLERAGLHFGGPPRPGATNVRICSPVAAAPDEPPGTGALRKPLLLPWAEIADLARRPGAAAADMPYREIFRGAGFGWEDLLAEAGPPGSWTDEPGEHCPSAAGVAAVILGLLYGLAMRG
ncbi:hypothetical protein [Mangrovicoccus sp. HB161399]|uniref:hypothetical protein n=1 Tax=Mangrovicoccus sp. HB161399 TaxID=2720392 RepID=UPI001553EB42|nr:hypothetical protein [Mangrovicoccus sp. HB161399]